LLLLNAFHNFVCNTQQQQPRKNSGGIKGPLPGLYPISKYFISGSTPAACITLHAMWQHLYKPVQGWPGVF
jgi:hypothetical protein